MSGHGDNDKGIPRSAKSTVPFLRVPLVVLNEPRLSHLEQLVLAQIDAFTTDNEPCRASNARLAKLRNTSTDRMNAVLRRLQRDSFLHRLGFHRVYVYRVVDPKYSIDPKRSKKWIEANSRVVKNDKSRVVENDSPQGSRVVENDSRGWSKTTDR